MTEIDAWYTLQNVFEVTDILEDKEYDLRNWRDVRWIVSTLNKVTGNAFRLQKENEQLVNAINNWKDSYDELYSDNKILEKENEQLQQELFESQVDYYAETFHDNPIRADDKINSLKREFKERFGKEFKYD